MLKIRLLGPRSQVLHNTEDDVRMFFLGSPVRYNLVFWQLKYFLPNLYP